MHVPLDDSLCLSDLDWSLGRGVGTRFACHEFPHPGVDTSMSHPVTGRVGSCKAWYRPIETDKRHDSRRSVSAVRLKTVDEGSCWSRDICFPKRKVVDRMRKAASTPLVIMRKVELRHHCTTAHPGILRRSCNGCIDNASSLRKAAVAMGRFRRHLRSASMLA